MRRLAAGLLTALLGIAVGMPGTASAAEDDPAIVLVEPADAGIKVLVSVPAGVAPEDVHVSVDDKQLDSTAARADESAASVRRTTVLAIDTSQSMARNGRLEAAKDAASLFLESVPDDVYVGVVTFDADVETPLEPSQDRAAAQKVIAGLGLARQTRLNDGILQAIKTAGTEGQRSVLVLSDGRDTSKTRPDKVTDAIRDAEVTVDVVALDQVADDLAPLQSMAEAGNGSVISANSDALRAAFSRQADALTRQVLVDAKLPSDVTDEEATVTVTVDTESGIRTATAYAAIRTASTAPDAALAESDAAPAFTVPRPLMLGAVVALGLAMLMLASVVLVPRKAAPSSAEDRILAFGNGAQQAPSAHRAEAAPALDQAKMAAAKVLRRNRGLEQRIAQRLEGAGSALKPAEWLLLHSVVIVSGGGLGVILGGGALPLVLVGLLAGWLLPKLWLSHKRRRRLRAFDSGLADTLQLIAGSLSAGMSLAQSVDVVVTEGQEPIAGEFKRVLVESRLGVSLEDALEGLSERVQSKDFAWVVMAIRIQRQVGGNLAELLTTVASTLRERDYVRRQIKSLAAEGKLSAYILGGLPPGVAIFLLMFRREYIMPLFGDVLGIAMLAAAGALLAMAAFVMSRIIKVEV